MSSLVGFRHSAQVRSISLYKIGTDCDSDRYTVKHHSIKKLIKILQ
jgi:hypothetical protein